MTLLDLIPLWASITGAAATLLFLIIGLRIGLIDSVADPVIHSYFQLCFSFSVLVLSGYLPIEDIIGFAIFMAIVIGWRNVPVRGKAWTSAEDWLAFSGVFAVVLVVLNIVVISQKGLLFLSDNISVARQEFWVGWGIFRRFNELGVGIMSISAAYEWARHRRIRAVLMGLLAAYAAITIGSRSGLIQCLFAYGAYLYFVPSKVSNARLVTVGAVLSVFTIGTFYVMYGVAFLPQFAYRLLSESDGPAYYFADKMYNAIRLGPGYPLDILMVSLRLRDATAYDPLGWLILGYHFHADNIQGPNPQMFVESHVLMRGLSLLWYPIVGVIFVVLRRKACHAYSFFLAMMFLTAFVMDLALAGSQIFSIGLAYGMFLVFLGARWLLRWASKTVHGGLEAASA